MDKILVVDDDIHVCDVVADLLSENEFVVKQANTLKRAREVLASGDIIVAIVDIRLHEGNGLDLIKDLNGSRTTGTLILSGCTDVVDRIIGLEFGADDYLTKPFHTRELLVRVKRMVSRMHQLSGRGELREPVMPLRIRDITIDPARHMVTAGDGSPINLSKPEVRTLATLVENRGVVMSRDDIQALVVGPFDRHPDDRRVDVYISNIRRKLACEKNLIRTVHRIGYIVD